MNKNIFCIFALVSLFFTTGFEDIEKLPIKVTHVGDGDSFKANLGLFPIEVRIYGIDAPEYTQAHGKEARNALAKLVENKNISIQALETDSYKRAISIVYLPNGKILQEELLKNGEAWLYTYYCKHAICKEWKKLEEEAKSKKIGLWANNKATPPWEYRRKNKKK